MALHTYIPSAEILSKHFKGFKDEELPGYLHILLEARYANDADVLTDFKPYFESAHLDARIQFHDEIGIDLHPDAGLDDNIDTISYPASLPVKAKRGLFGEAFSGLLTETCTYIGDHSWVIPVFLFRFHQEAGAYLFTLRRNPDAKREMHGRKSDDFIAICIDEDGNLERVLSGEAKWRKTLTQSVVDALLYGDKVKDEKTGISEHNGRGILDGFNRAVDPPHGLKQVQRILKSLDPEGHADTIFSIDQAVLANTSTLPRTNLIVIAGNGGARRKPSTPMIPWKSKPEGYTSSKDLQVVEVIFDGGETMIDALYDALYED